MRMERGDNMPKPGELDWSDLMKGNVGEPEDPRSKPVEARGPLNKMKKPPMPSDLAIRKAIMEGAPAQPTDEQLFGHLVPTEEQVEKAEKKWDGTFNDFFKEVNKPVDPQTNVHEWGRKPIMDELSDEERAEWNTHIGSDPEAGQK